MKTTASTMVGMLLGAMPITISVRRRTIDLMEVKELYDAACEAKAQARVNLKQYKALMAKAEKLDAAYRAQLARGDNNYFFSGKVA